MALELDRGYIEDGVTWAIEAWELHIGSLVIRCMVEDSVITVVILYKHNGRSEQWHRYFHKIIHSRMLWLRRIYWEVYGWSRVDHHWRIRTCAQLQVEQVSLIRHDELVEEGFEYRTSNF